MVFYVQCPHSCQAIINLSMPNYPRIMFSVLDPAKYNDFLERGKSVTGHNESVFDNSEVFGELVGIIMRLRSDSGCPWDRKQTPLTFHHYILEEYHELVHAINNGDPASITDELGDLLFLVVFVGYMFEQSGTTTITQVMQNVIAKMRRRHPHVFGDVSVASADEVIDNWRKIKAGEENIRKRESILDGIPRSLPALSRSQKLAARAARVGFDWTRPEEVMAKVDEELQEFKDSVVDGHPGKIREELGDLLFVIVNAARHLNINSEAALTESSDKFERRFRHIEKSMHASGRSLDEAGLGEMDELWDEAKALERK